MTQESFSHNAFQATCIPSIGHTDCEVSDPAMTKGQTEQSYVEQPKTYRTIEAPITYELVQRDNERQTGCLSRTYSKPSNHKFATQPLPQPLVDDLISRPEHPHPSSRSIPHSQEERLTSPPHHVTNISVIDSHKSRPSHASSSQAKTARQSDFIPITEVRSAKDVHSLPDGRVTSLVAEEREEDGKVDKSSVSPKESVSQVSTKRSGRNREGSKY